MMTWKKVVMAETVAVAWINKVAETVAAKRQGAGMPQRGNTNGQQMTGKPGVTTNTTPPTTTTAPTKEREERQKKKEIKKIWWYRSHCSRDQQLGLGRDVIGTWSFSSAITVLKPANLISYSHCGNRTNIITKGQTQKRINWRTLIFSRFASCSALPWLRWEFLCLFVFKTTWPVRNA